MSAISRLVFLFLLFCVINANGQITRFEIKDGQFVYDGKSIQIHSGEMHYARIPREYWTHRLRMIKAMGLNAVATYVFWNYHHPSPAEWDFKTENRNIREFIQMAQQEGLFVILRPGPYACAEWEFGGYPWWLQQNKDLVIRANNKPFLDSCRTYIQKLAHEVKGLESSRGGPIIMVQVENEFGSYVAQRKDISLQDHKSYNAAIYEMLQQSGFNGPFFTSDGSWLFEGGSIPGVLPTANGEGNVDNLRKAVNQYNNNSGPYMVAEYYPGWLDHWGEPFNRVKSADVVEQLRKYLETKTHFNIYMAHGGTNFGFTSGANYNAEHQIQPDITSYDYDAPISEAGRVTEKFLAIRELLKQHASYEVPEIPSPISVLSPRSFNVTRGKNFLDVKHSLKSVVSDRPLTFEELNQGHGLVLYSKAFPAATSGQLKIEGLRDYARVFVNNQFAGELNRQSNQYSVNISIPKNGTLDILVENMGRINYGADIIHNRKGIISPVKINGQDITGSWEMYKLPLHAPPDFKLKKSAAKDLPAVYEVEATLTEVGDTFLDMSNWGKGVVFVNGRNIGRYWNIGPQQTLFLPGCWLKKGKNRIVIFEMMNSENNEELRITDKPILEQLRNDFQKK
jgi:beta-galactosidase